MSGTATALHRARVTNHIGIIALVVLCVISFFVSLGASDVSLMEARNLVTAREMAAQNNWLIPTMNGEIRLAKPPMPTWFVAAISRLAGSSDDLSILRLPSALAACLLVFSIYGLSLAMDGNSHRAFLCAAMLVTSALLIHMGRTASWDIFCHAFMAAALWALWTGLHQGTGKRAFVLAGACLGLSFMSKGPVSFYALLLPFFLAYLFVFGSSTIRSQWRGLCLALFICLLLSCWWPIYILVYHADLARLVMHEETQAWGNHHVEPWWYYWNFLAYTGGWLVWAFAALLRPYAVERAGSRQTHAFLLLWLAAALVLLSLIPEKKERYLLPAMIPVVLVAGDLAYGVILRFRQDREQRADRMLVLIHCLLTGALCVGLPVVLFVVLKQRHQALDGAFFGYGLGSCIAAFCLPGFFIRRQVKRQLQTSIVFLALTTLGASHYYAELSIRNTAYRTADRFLLDRQIGTSKVYFLGDPVDMKVIRDLGRRVYPWQTQEVNRALAQDEPVAVISKGEPSALLPNELRTRVFIETIDILDYNKKRPDARKIHIALLRAKEPGATGELPASNPVPSHTG